MLKYALLGGAMMIAAPAFAQDMQTAPQQAPTTQTAPATTDPVAPAMAQDAAPVAPAQDAAATAETQPATGAEVADVVSTEFASYDKDGNGALSPAEFDRWMIALKTASDPSTKPASKATRTWLGQAFAQADKDKSRSVSKTELTGFLKG